MVVRKALPDPSSHTSPLSVKEMLSVELEGVNNFQFHKPDVFETALK